MVEEQGGYRQGLIEGIGYRVSNVCSSLVGIGQFG